mgnify:CR=1 FL=1
MGLKEHNGFNIIRNTSPFNRTAYGIERQEYPINSKRDLIHQYSIQTISIFRSCFLYVQ